MKSIRLLLISLCLLLFSQSSLLAGQNDWHFSVAPGYFINPFERNTLHSLQIGFEKELSGRNMAGFTILSTEKELYYKGTFSTADYSVFGYYKPNIYMGKNDNLYVSFGGNLGSGLSKGVTFGLNVGFEYSVTFRNRMKLYFSQDNLLTFRSDNLLISGVSIGLKIPLSR